MPVVSLRNGRLISQFGLSPNAVVVSDNVDSLPGEEMPLRLTNSPKAEDDEDAAMSESDSEQTETNANEAPAESSTEGTSNENVDKGLTAAEAIFSDLMLRKRGRPTKILVEDQDGDQRKTRRVLDLEAKFVDLSVVLPPLPQKGHFDVSTIKKSLYFFS